MVGTVNDIWICGSKTSSKTTLDSFVSETSDELQIVINFTTDVVVHQAIVVVHTKDERGTLFQTVWRWDGAKREGELGLWKY